MIEAEKTMIMFLSSLQPATFRNKLFRQEHNHSIELLDQLIAIQL
jgi:hypothetical protein